MMNQKPLRGIQVNKTHPLSRGLVGCWILNEGTGDIIFDLSGNDNLGINNGAEWEPAGLDFISSNNDYIQLSNKIIFADGEPWSFVISVDVDFLYSYFGFAGHIMVPGSYSRLMTDVLGEIRVYNDANVRVTFFTFVQTGVHDYAVVYDGTNVNVYRDGIYVNSLAHGGVFTFYRLFGIGNTSANTLDGSGKNVRIYNRILSGDEIKLLYKEPYVMFEPSFNPEILYTAAVAAGVPNPGAMMMMVM